MSHRNLWAEERASGKFKDRRKQEQEKKKLEARRLKKMAYKQRGMT